VAFLKNIYIYIYIYIYKHRELSAKKRRKFSGSKCNFSLNIIRLKFNSNFILNSFKKNILNLIII
jgi:hypothetical protein